MIVAVLLLAVTDSAAAQERTIAVRAADPRPIETHTRRTVTFAIAVDNGGPKGRTLMLEPGLPNGWTPLIATDRFVLAPRSSDFRLASFLVPAMTPAGEYDLLYALTDPEDSSAAAACPIKVIVLPEVSIDVKLLEAPSFVLAGTEYTASFALFNNGNTGVGVDLEVTCGVMLPFSIDGVDEGSTVFLPIGGTRELRVTVRTDAAQIRSMRHSLQVLARQRPADGIPAADKPLPLARAQSAVEVIPLSVDDRLIRHTLPARSETSALVSDYSGERSWQFQENLDAAGTLDEEGEHEIELHLSKILEKDGDFLNNPMDRYSLQYRSRIGELSLGDLSYSLSPLLAWEEFGRGVEATVNFFPVRVNTLYYGDNWSSPQRRALGGGVDFTVPRSDDWENPVYRVGANALSALDERVAFGLFQEYSPWESVSFQLDSAMQTQPSGEVAPALFAFSHGDLGITSWTARFVRAWPGFEAAESDTQRIQASTGVRLLDGALHLRGGVFVSESNLALDADLPNADRTVELTLGAGGTLPQWGTRLDLDWENWRRIDRLPDPDYGTRNNIFRLNARQPLPPFTVSLASTIDLGFDEIDGSTALGQKYELFGEYAPGENTTYSVSLRFDGRRDSEDHSLNLWGWTVGARHKTGRTTIEGRAENSYIFIQTGLSEILAGMNAKLTHIFPWGHTLTAEGYYGFSVSSSETTPSFFLSLSYATPFEVPLGRKHDSSVVAGRVFDASSGKGMPDVLLRLDRLAAMTDKDGRFTFYIPHSGTSYVQIDRSTVEADMVTLKPMPLEVTTSGGSSAYVEIGLVKGCTVSGNVGLYGFPTGSEALLDSGRGNGGGGKEPERVRTAGLGNIIVELSDGVGTWRRLTGVDGDFRFQEVRPGRYTLRLVGNRIPALHKVTPPAFELDLSSGDEKTVEFRVVQEQRLMQLVESGASIVLESPAGIEEGATLSMEGKTPPAEKRAEETEAEPEPAAVHDTGAAPEPEAAAAPEPEFAYESEQEASVAPEAASQPETASAPEPAQEVVSGPEAAPAPVPGPSAAPAPAAPPVPRPAQPPARAAISIPPKSPMPVPFKGYVMLTPPPPVFIGPIPR